MSTIIPPTYVIVQSDGNVLSTVPPASSLNLNPIVGPVLQVLVSSPGSTYTPGTYSVPLTDTTTPAATGIVAEVVVTGNVVSGVIITNNGNGAALVSDVLAPTAPFGGGTGFQCTVLAVPVSGSVLELGGANSLDWGQNLWTNLTRMVENFAASSAPGTNLVLGGTNVTPLYGQLWFDTVGQALNVYTTTGWVTLETSGVTSVNGTAGEILASPTTGTVVLSLVATAVTPGSYTNTSLTVDAFGRITAATSGGGGAGTVTNVSAVTSVGITGNPALVISGSPITSSGTLTFAVSPELNGIAALNTLGIIKRTAVGTYGIAVAADINTTLGYTPYNASNPAGYITASSTITLTGNVTGSGPTTAVVTTIANNVVTNAKLAQAATLTLKGNNTGVTANVADLTPAQVITMLPLFTTTVNGLVPNPGTVSGKFLRDDGTWQVGGSAGFLHATNGYEKFASGLIWQWGTYAYNGSSAFTVTFPIAFTTACFNAQVSQPPSVSYGYTLPVSSFTKTQLNVGAAPGVAGNVYWFAIGV